MVNVSDMGIASQIPSSPNTCGTRINAGIRKVKPRKNAKKAVGLGFSILWKYPITVKFNTKQINPKAK